MFKKVLLFMFVSLSIFTLTACGGNQDAEALEDALASLTIDTEVTDDLALPTSLDGDIEVSWSSSDPEVIANDGTVVRPDYSSDDVTVTLTATLALGEEELTKDFSVVVLAADSPIEAITDGYFVYSFFAEGYGEYTSFFNFYEEDPVLGAVFYLGSMNNATNAAGTYTVEEVDFEWIAFPDRASLEDENIDPLSGTAPFTISFYDFEGNLLDQAGYDGEFVYNDMEHEALAPYGASNVYYSHDTDENSGFSPKYEGEVGIPYVALEDPTDSAATLSLNHNKTYTDLIGDIIVEGSWGVEENSNGELVFTLTPNESFDVGATVVLNEDKTAATYTSDGSDEAVELIVPVEDQGPEPILSVTDDTHKMHFYEDGTYMYTFSTLEEFGTWTFVNYTLTIIQSDGTETVATMDGTTHALSFHYQNLASDQVSADFTIPSSDWGSVFGAGGTYTPVVPNVVLSFVGAYEGAVTIDIIIELYDNGDVVVIQEMAGAGTEEIEVGTYTLSGSGATTSYDIELPSGSYAGVLNSSYDGLEFNYTYEIPSGLGGGTEEILVESDLPASE